jgi:DNA replicative helicase MCM subunit Mcm2 (Cdc46/Mcm family)
MSYDLLRHWEFFNPPTHITRGQEENINVSESQSRDQHFMQNCFQVFKLEEYLNMQSKHCTPVINNIASQEIIQNFMGKRAYTHACTQTKLSVSED